jgi:hypothetical protein
VSFWVTSGGGHIGVVLLCNSRDMVYFGIPGFKRRRFMRTTIELESVLME